MLAPRQSLQPLPQLATWRVVSGKKKVMSLYLHHHMANYSQSCVNSYNLNVILRVASQDCQVIVKLTNFHNEDPT